jgi:DNA polymerase I-like protein with 3'-5' exonuclease and polymerase domains
MTEGATPFVVTSVEQIHQLVADVQQVGAFAFDVETRGILERHPDMVSAMEKAWKKHVSSLKNPSPEIQRRAHENFEAKYRGMLAVDPLRNDVFWIGIATRGKSWAIPMGHPLGEIIEPEEIGDGTTTPPSGYRKILKNGQESMAKAKYHKPAVFSEAPPQLSRSVVFEALRPLFFSDLVKVGHNVKFDARSICKYYGELPPGLYADTMLLQHLVNENLMSYSLENLIMHNYGKHDAYYRDGKLGKFITSVPFSKAVNYVHLDVRWTWLLYERLWNKVKTDTQLVNSFYQDTEVLHILMHMENEGIPVDHRNMELLGKELDTKMRDILLALYEYTPTGFNPDSTKHKQEFLFNKKREGGLGLKPYKLTKGGAPSVDEETLRFLEKEHPALELLIQWSETQKLKSTYVDGMLPRLYKSKLHPSFHLHRTATGRLSSSDPNLQNIPRDSNVRSLFVAPEGHTLLVADYDQIELRVMAMFSQDKELLHVFNNNIDIHTGAAALLFKKDVAEVTDEERQIGKGVNFLTAYGGGAGKLARTTGIPFEQAQEMIQEYYRQFSGLTEWKQKVVAEGRKYGHVTTLSGRRRRLPDLMSSDSEARSRAERQAVNAVVQGSAADLCKQAMINIAHDLADKNIKMLVQVHDELVVAVPYEELDNIVEPFITSMGNGNVIKGVPLMVSYHNASNWSEAKG